MFDNTRRTEPGTRLLMQQGAVVLFQFWGLFGGKPKGKNSCIMQEKLHSLQYMGRGKNCGSMKN